MALIGCKEFLVPMIMKGDPQWKFGTIRALRKYPIHVGETLWLYKNPRKVNCEYLGVTLCSAEYKFNMHLGHKKPRISHYTLNSLPYYWKDYWHYNNHFYDWPRRMLAELAIQDGFSSINEMWDWFKKTHGEHTQVFQRIEWKWPPQKLDRNLRKEEIKRELESDFPIEIKKPENTLLKWCGDFRMLPNLSNFSNFDQLPGEGDI